MISRRVVWRGETVECARLVLDMEGEKEYSVKMQALSSYACWKVLGVRRPGQ